MLVYDLICSQGHNFEGWFQDLDDLESQMVQKFLACPICGDESISRRPSTFGVVKSSRSEKQVAPVKTGGANALPDIKDLINRWNDLSQRLEKEFVDVGSNFTEEALKMHYGVLDRRNIRGVSTEQQDEILRKEGVEFVKVPLVRRKDSGESDC